MRACRDRRPTRARATARRADDTSRPQPHPYRGPVSSSCYRQPSLECGTFSEVSWWCTVRCARGAAVPSFQRVTLMPVVSFESLPDASRVWVFASAPALPAAAAKTVLSGVDSHLKEWKAHGEPLTVSREWIEDRFLVVAVDQTHTGASGCSIDGLFRVLQQLENSVHASLVGGGRVYYRDHHGVIQAVGR